MIRFQLQPDDLLRMRFAYSPLLELSVSYQNLRCANSHPSDAAYGPYSFWINEARQALRNIEFAYMDAVILEKSYIVDFLSAPPSTSQRHIEDEFNRLRNTPDELIRKYTLCTIDADGITDTRQMFLDFPQESLECLIQEMRFYWQQTLAHHWDNIRSVLENDMHYRARQVALEGTESVFTDLAQNTYLKQNELHIYKPHQHHKCKSDYELTGQGLQLVPSIFMQPHCTVMWQAAPEWLPMLIYGARGAGLWHPAEPEDINESLEIALGPARARLLQTLIIPANTGELARKLHVTAGAVSQHLGKLAQAGLVESHRSGSHVFYQLSARGERLLDVFTQ